MLVLTATFAAADTSSKAIAQGFRVSGNSSDIVAGAIVSVKQSDPQSVELATTQNTAQLIGVVDINPLLVISGSDTKAQVVLNGTTTVLVSDINGAISSGDKVTASPIAGVGMRATADSQIVGTAQARFTSSDGQSRTIKDSKGVSHVVHIGYVPLQIGVAYYQAPGSNFLPPFIQRIANSLAGKPVSLIRILLAGILILFCFVAVTVIIYASVRSAMTSLGRNPMAASAIRKSLYQVILVAGAGLIAAILASYIIITA